MRSLQLAVVASLVLGACEGESYDSMPTTETGSFAASVLEAHLRMHLRFDAARRMEEAIAESDLDRAHAEARGLAQLDDTDSLPIWRPYYEDIRDAAHQVEVAGDVITAARVTGTLGLRCAKCHVAITAHVTFPAEPRPSDDPKQATQMMGHQWAAVQMWEGLIGPSDDRWTAGAQALTTVPLNMIAASLTPTSDFDIDDVARIRLYARRAMTAKPQDTRAEIFGDLLAACAHCHAVLRDR